MSIEAKPFVLFSNLQKAELKYNTSMIMNFKNHVLVLALYVLNQQPNKQDIKSSTETVNLNEQNKLRSCGRYW